MLHNWLLVKPGSAEEVGAIVDQMASQPDGFSKGYIPDSDKILVASKLLSPNEVQKSLLRHQKNRAIIPTFVPSPDTGE